MPLPKSDAVNPTAMYRCPMNRKDFAEAESLLLAAHEAYDREGPPSRPTHLDPRTTVSTWLGRICRLTGRYEDAINAYERGLPTPAAFEGLVAVFRFRGKAARKDGDHAAHGECYRRMYCLANLYATVMTLRIPDVPVAVDWGRATRWLEDVRQQCGTIYAYHFDGQPVADDTLPSKADYGVLDPLLPGGK